ncbi:MAG: MEKHLA domain-containing protein [Cytophagaceae bacterium]|nr:MEKHLA domain-containing protein [Cytophagaceae bacterium]MDW8455311.1 MEKHLA domain-containing protein [Cytophagaceae bacterium]
MNDKPHLSDFAIRHVQLLCSSFQTYTGRMLIPDYKNLKASELAEILYHAPFVVVSHGTEADPVFNYANLAAQALWKLSWQDFVKLPSRYSAEPMMQAERDALLKRAKTYGFIPDYTGVRITSIGERFRIYDTILWNITDENGLYHGQAAMFERWEFIHE